jgi:hypothetical protein
MLKYRLPEEDMGGLEGEERVNGDIIETPTARDHAFIRRVFWAVQQLKIFR